MVEHIRLQNEKGRFGTEVLTVAFYKNNQYQQF
jgi:hypothetical protein